MNFNHGILASPPLGYVILGLCVTISISVLAALFRCMYYTGKTCQLCHSCCCHGHDKRPSLSSRRLEQKNDIDSLVSQLEQASY